jgi:hypothetical protein
MVKMKNTIFTVYYTILQHLTRFDRFYQASGIRRQAPGFFRQDLQDYSGLFFIFSSFQMKLEKLNPLSAEN